MKFPNIAAILLSLLSCGKAEETPLLERLDHVLDEHPDTGVENLRAHKAGHHGFQPDSIASALFRKYNL